VLDKTVRDALEQLGRGGDVSASLVKRLAGEGLCTGGPHPVLTAFGADVLRLRQALADPSVLVEPRVERPPEYCIDVTAGELELLRLASGLSLDHPEAQPLPRPVQPRQQDGALVLDLDERQLAAVGYVFRLYAVTSSTRFHNRLLRRISYGELTEHAGQDG